MRSQRPGRSAPPSWSASPWTDQRRRAPVVLKPVKGSTTGFTFTKLSHGVGFTDVSWVPLARLAFAHRIEHTGAGSRFTHRVTMTSPLAPLFSQVFGRSITASLSTAVRALARLIERTPTQTRRPPRTRRSPRPRRPRRPRRPPRTQRLRLGLTREQARRVRRLGAAPALAEGQPGVSAPAGHAPLAARHHHGAAPSRADPRAVRAARLRLVALRRDRRRRGLTQPAAGRRTRRHRHDDDQPGPARPGGPWPAHPRT